MHFHAVIFHLTTVFNYLSISCIHVSFFCSMYYFIVSEWERQGYSLPNTEENASIISVTEILWWFHVIRRHAFNISKIYHYCVSRDGLLWRVFHRNVNRVIAVFTSTVHANGIFPVSDLWIFGCEKRMQLWKTAHLSNRILGNFVSFHAWYLHF